MGMPVGRASISSLASSNIHHGHPPERITSITSIETAGTMDTIKGKRRSGFLGLGRKKDRKNEADKAQVGWTRVLFLKLYLLVNQPETRLTWTGPATEAAAGELVLGQWSPGHAAAAAAAA
jgi:hypothetical protein